MAEGDDSFVSTPVVLAATFGAAAALIGILYTLKADTVKTKVALQNGKARNSTTSAASKRIKGPAKDKARRGSDAARRRAGSSESTSVDVAEGTSSKRKKRNGQAPVANNSSGKDDRNVAAPRAVPPAREPPPASAAQKQQRMQQQQQQTTDNKQDEGGGEGGEEENGGVGAEAAAGGPSKSAKRKQRKKKRSPAVDAPASSSTFVTPHTSVAGADGIPVTSSSAAGAGATALNSPTAGDDAPPREEDTFTIVSKQKSSRKKFNANADGWVAAVSGNSTPNQASSASGATYRGGRFNVLADDNFAH